MHPGHLGTRYLATYAFYREGLPAASIRLRNHLSQRRRHGRAGDRPKRWPPSSPAACIAARSTRPRWLRRPAWIGGRSTRWPSVAPARPTRRGRPMTPRYDVNLSILFTELPVLQRPAAAADEGFDAIEFWWPFLSPCPAMRTSTASPRRSRTPASSSSASTSSPVRLPVGTVVWCPGRRGRRSSRTTSTSRWHSVRAWGCRAFNALLRQPSRRPVGAGAGRPRRREPGAGRQGGGRHRRRRAGGARQRLPRYPLLKAADSVAVIDRSPA